MIYVISVFSFILINFLFFKFAHYINLIDNPNERKKHAGKIPLTGGLVIYLNIFLLSFFFKNTIYINVIFYTSILIVILGFVDDLKGLGINFKLIIQIFTSLIIINSGLLINNIGDYYFFPEINLGLLSILFTVFCVISLTNAFNFIDGLDGLCSSLSIVTFFSMFIFSYFSETVDNIPDFNFIFLIIFSIFIFLLFNISSNFKIFLGDSGSLFLGFFISWLLILFTQVENQVFHPVLTLWCVTIPTFDIFFVTFKRISMLKSPFKADRIHIHHSLLNLGFSNKKCLLVITLLSFLLNMLGLILFIYFGQTIALISFFVLLILYTFIMVIISKEVKENRL